jgi:hypothetical protein
LGELGGRGSPAKVKGDVLFAGDDIVAGLLDAPRKVDLAEVAQVGDLGADAIAWNEGDGVRFHFLILE